MTNSLNNITLRPYQQDCVDKIKWDLGIEGNSLCVVATGGGKSVIIASAVHVYSLPTLILQPSKEILEQNLDKLMRYVPREEIGVYSASMGEKDIKMFTFATIQSIYKRPDLFSHFGLIIIDECHLVNVKSTSGMFASFLKEINKIRLSTGLKKVKVLGFSATPFRMDTMYVDWGKPSARIVTTTKLVNRVKGFFWSKILYNLSMSDLINMGYLCKPRYIDTSIITHKDIPLNITGSEFNLTIAEQFLEAKKDRVINAVEWSEKNSRSVLIFCISIKQAEDLKNKIYGAEIVTGKTPKKERERIINDFKSHKIKTVLNVGVLTTGFDHPALDCIILLRPTRSIMMYVQMLGRGVRIAEGKEYCKIIDFTGTVRNLGRVETIRVEKVGGNWDIVTEKGLFHATELYSINMNDDQPLSDYNSYIDNNIPF